MLQFNAPNSRELWRKIKIRTLDVTYAVVRVIFHPFSFIFPIAVGFIISLLPLIADRENMHPWILWCLGNLSYFYVIIGAWFVISIVFTYSDNKINDLKTQRDALKSSIVEKDRQLDMTAGMILHKHGEFAEFSRGILLKEVLKEFVDKKCEVDGCQLYRHSIQHMDDKTVIRLTYDQGYCYENVDLNGIMQSYYILPYSEYVEIQKAISLWREIYLLPEQTKPVMENKLFDTTTAMFTRIQTKLNSLVSIEAIMPEQYSLYRILYVLSVIMGDTAISTVNRLLQKEKQKIEDHLKNEKRTGILGGILLDDMFIFSHTGESKKRGRVYMCFPFQFNGIDYVSMCAVSKRNLSDSEGIDNEARKLQTDFFEILESKC